MLKIRVSFNKNIFISYANNKNFLTFEFALINWIFN